MAESMLARQGPDLGIGLALNGGRIEKRGGLCSLPALVLGWKVDAENVPYDRGDLETCWPSLKATIKFMHIQGGSS